MIRINIERFWDKYYLVWFVPYARIKYGIIKIWEFIKPIKTNTKVKNLINRCSTPGMIRGGSYSGKKLPKGIRKKYMNIANGKRENQRPDKKFIIFKLGG